MIPIAAVLLAAAAAPDAAVAVPRHTPDAAPLVVEVANVRNARGMVHVTLCPQAQFLGDSCPYNAKAPAQSGVTLVRFAAVPPGDYAAQAFQDENLNDRVDRGLFGIPKEGVGFSRDARIVLSPPKWRDAVFEHAAKPQSIRFALRYFSGPESPEAWRAEHEGQ